MKRFHVHLAVEDLAQNIQFYSHLFGQQPTVERADYAKWMLDDPRVNFAISTRGHDIGVNHFGFQAENADELNELKQRAQAAAGNAVLDEGATTCCYSVSEKHWTVDPSGLAWEHYHTMGEAESYGVERPDVERECCVPVVAKPEQACCVPNANAPAGKCC